MQVIEHADQWKRITAGKHFCSGCTNGKSVNPTIPTRSQLLNTH